ncbi:MAG: shikimate dehydrogenase [Oleiphilaceae bacterium]|nr:shikimate dehydrogenase [Oleiphilaceae bacterium]
MSDKQFFAVVGNPIAHSKSPEIHHAFAQAEGLALDYSRLEAPLDAFEETVRSFFSQSNHRGLNVTVPFKEQAVTLAEQLTERAQLAGAVNTLWQNQNGQICGDTTDGAGLVFDLKNNNEIALTDKKILVIGAGGAVRGVLQPILNEKPADIVLCNRTLEKAEALAALFNELGNIRTRAFRELEGPFDLVINGTSASLGGALPPLPDSVIGKGTVVYDMMYGASTTPFNQWALDLGAKQAIDGLGMLVEQAAEAFFIWHGVRPDTRDVLRNLRGN